MPSRPPQAAAALIAITFAAGGASGQFDPPAGYYAGATGTGATLKSQLATAMTTGHIQRRYGDFRYASVLFDTDPNNSSRIILAYNGASVSGTWDSGSTWNREHVWPQSLQPGSASNSTRGNLGDPHALRPCNPGINSSRGNKPFGTASTTGNFGSLGTFYFPGDTDKGDIARSLFYSATRWQSLGLTLVNGSPGSNQMGDLASHIAWHYLDTPGTFERRRNHNISSQAENPSYYTNNRNAYVDMPEFAWSVFIDQANDSTLYVGQTPEADGSSSLDVFFESLLVGDPVTETALVTINKDGNDGSYYSVTPGIGATSSVEGKFNAFPIITSGSASREIELGFGNDLDDNQGRKTAQVVVDNRDVTTQGGAGRGANDGDDVVTLVLDIYERSEGSFDPALDIDTVQLDLGTISLGGGDASQGFTLYNLPTGDPMFTAPMELIAGAASGDTAALSTDFEPTTLITSGGAGGVTFFATLDDTNEGVFTATYAFRPFDDSAFANAGEGATLVLELSGTVEAAGCVADVTTINTNPGDAGYGTPDGFVDGADLSYYIEQWLAGDAGVADVTTINTNPGDAGYGAPDGFVDGADLSFFIEAWLAGCA